MFFCFLSINFYQLISSSQKEMSDQGKARAEWAMRKRIQNQKKADAMRRSADVRKQEDQG